ncbi:MAG: tripartite tricarboxylate transporter substrate binding protein, partial [Phenylobacterium sp.]|uniref:Bug family tripartite tricarboxylate transporter substrate binding protein n=1 Tax=Phenylobacterium sp. TaxID=1871053 RepID=UPI002734942E
ADGLPAIDAVARAPADGNSLLMTGINTLCITPAMYPKQRIEPLRLFTPISLIARGYPLLLAHPHTAPNSRPTLMTSTASTAAELRFASPGVRSVQHLAGRMMQERTGLRLLYVQYANQAQAMQDLMAGHTDLSIEYGSVSVPLVKAGKLKALAVLGPQRNPALPDLMTAREQGIADMEVGAWAGMVAPDGTAPARIQRLRETLHRVMQEREFVAWVTGLGSTPAPSSSQTFADVIQHDSARWARQVVAAGMVVP